MNKLFKFAGVSALALVTAAPNAFGAGGYGQYNPSCPTQNGVAVKVYGFKDGKYKLLPDVDVTYDPLARRYTLDGAGITTWESILNKLDLTAPGEGIKVYTNAENTETDTVDITTNLVPYAVGFVNGAPSPDSTFQKMLTAAATAVPYNYIATTSTCTIPGDNAKNALIRVFDDNGPTSETYQLPDIHDDVFSDEGIIQEVSFLVYYAAACIGDAKQNENHATCKFNVDTEGRVTYKNSCMSGYGGAQFGDVRRVCLQDITTEPTTDKWEKSEEGK